MIIIFLFVLFFVYKWINPTGANALWNWIKTAPITSTNYINREILKKDIIIPLKNTTENTQIEIAPEEKEIIKDQPEKKVSWFARIFKKKKKTDTWVQEVNITTWNIEEPTWSKSITNEETILSGSVIAVEQASGIVTLEIVDEQVTPTLETWTITKTNQESEDEVIYIPSNPKSASTTEKSENLPTNTSSTNTKGLSAEDLREAEEIFGK